MHSTVHRGHKFVRYADDFIILVKSLRAGERVFEGISRFLKRELKLEVNPSKSKVAKVDECEFLGFCMIRGKIRWSRKSVIEFKRRIKELTGRSWGVSMAWRYGASSGRPGPGIQMDPHHIPMLEGTRTIR